MAISPAMRIPIAVVAVLAIIVSFILMIRGCGGTEFTMPETEALGAWSQAMAGECDRLLEGGGQIVLASWDPDAWSAPARKAQRDGFLKAIKPSRNIEVMAEELYVPPRDNPFLVALTPESLQEILQKYGDVDLIVSLVGVPTGDSSAMAALQDSLPPILCTAMQIGPNEEIALESGLVAAVVMPSPGGDDSYVAVRAEEF